MALVWAALGVKAPTSFSKKMQQMHHFSAHGTVLCGYVILGHGE